MPKDEYKSAVYTNRPDYADFEPAAKFQAVESIIAKRLIEHPKAVSDLEKIAPYEPQLVKAAWAVFGDSYRYRQAYNEYKAKRMAEEKQINGQIHADDLVE